MADEAVLIVRGEGSAGMPGSGGGAQSIQRGTSAGTKSAGKLPVEGEEQSLLEGASSLLGSFLPAWVTALVDAARDIAGEFGKIQTAAMKDMVDASIPTLYPIIAASASTAVSGAAASELVAAINQANATSPNTAIKAPGTNVPGNDFGSAIQPKILDDVALAKIPLSAQLTSAGTIVSAALAAFKLMTDEAANVVHGLGAFASAIASPSDNPGQQLAAAGAAAESFGASFLIVNPALGAFTQITGAATNELGKFMGALDGLVGRYGQVNPAIATAQAQADVQNIMGELRRGQDAAPALVQYVQARNQLQQKIEDEKIKILNQIMPSVLSIASGIETLLPVVRLIAEITIIPDLSLLGYIADGIRVIAGNTRREDPDNLVAQNQIRDLFAQAPQE